MYCILSVFIRHFSFEFIVNKKLFTKKKKNQCWKKVNKSSARNGRIRQGGGRNDIIKKKKIIIMRTKNQK